MNKIKNVCNVPELSKTGRVLKDKSVLKNTNKNMRNAIIRISFKNVIHADNEKLGLKAGDIVEYTTKDILDILDNWCETKPFSYYVIEHNDDPENCHAHLVLEFRGNSQCKFNTLKGKFPYGFIDSCRHGVHACVRYLTHIDHPEKHQYSWDNVVTNNIAQLEKYKQPTKYCEQQYVNKLVEQICNGEIREFEVPDKIEPKLYVKYHATFKNAFDLRTKKLLNNITRNLFVCVLNGPPRVGKSCFCKEWAKKHGKSICFSSSGKHMAEELLGQDVFVLDDFNFEDMPIEEMLKLTDPHISTAISCRYHNRILNVECIFICSNTPVLSWYQEEDSVLREALYKRINLVLDFQDYKRKPVHRNMEYTYRLNYKTNMYEYLPWGENDNERLLKDGIASYTVNRIVKISDIDDKEKARDVSVLQIVDKDTDAALLSVDDKVHHFDLKKYVDVKADDTKCDEFISQLDDM